MERRDSALSDALKQLPIYTIGGWLWVYNTAATIYQGAKCGTDAKVLKEKLSLNWTSPFKILSVGPSPSDSGLPNCYTWTSPTTCRALTPTTEFR